MTSQQMTDELKEEMYGPQESGRKLKNNYVKHTNVTGQDNATLLPSYIFAAYQKGLILASIKMLACANPAPPPQLLSKITRYGFCL